MEKRRKIVQYRERLDKTLASPDLTNDEILKTLVKSQLLRSSEQEIEGYEEKLLETKTADVSNSLKMLRSASVDDSGRSNTSSTDWKLKQDNEEFRVMYREGPEGTPFHTLLVEGYVDGPVDVCLCVSWETSLYKKWWPQFTIPSFKVISSDCLQKVQIEEQISLVRVQVPWPLSKREAIVHYYLFEYFQDDLIVVLLNTVPVSKGINGLKNYAIPEAKDIVRIDLVGGFALQKVTSERSYFRTIANMDIKLDFVPPSLINFISRQLIGNGFRLYQRAVASMMSHDDQEFSKALGDPLYVRIREALYSICGSKSMNEEELKQVATVLPAEDLIQFNQDGAKDASCEDGTNPYANNFMSMTTNAIVVDNRKAFGEIEEADGEEIVSVEEEKDEKVLDIPSNPTIPVEEVDTRSVLKGKRNVYISSEVQQALEILEKSISVVREYGFHSCRFSSSFANEECPCVKKGGTVDSYSSKPFQPRLEGTSQEATGTNSDIQNFRRTGPNPNSKEVNYNKVVPAASPEQNLSRHVEASQVASYSLKDGITLDAVQDMCSDHDTKNSSREKKPNTLVTQAISSDIPNKSRWRKKLSTLLFSALAKMGEVKMVEQKKIGCLTLSTCDPQ